MNNLNDSNNYNNKKIAESIIKGKEMKRDLGNRIDTINDEEFFYLIDAIDNNSKIELFDLDQTNFVN